MKYLIIGLSLCILVACSSKSQTQPSKPSAESVRKEFKLPEIPMTIVDPGHRANYLAIHYWDHFNFADTSYIHLPEVTEQALANYINILDYTTSPDIISQSIKEMLTKAEADTAMLSYFCRLYDKYLYDPNSPMRNEEYYIPVLEKIISSNQIKEVEKIRPRHQLGLALKNRIGQKASDIEYTLASGATGHLHQIQSPYVVLFFYNPDCNMCKEVHEQLDRSSIITGLQQKKRVQIVALYPDEDIEAWRKHLPEIPSSWINGYDKALIIRNEETYDLKAIPTLYLLDKDKKVLLKDVTFSQLEEFLQQKEQL